MHDNEQHDRSQDGHPEASPVPSGHPGLPDQAHEEPAQERPNDADDDVEDDASATPSEEAGYQAGPATEHDPRQNAHNRTSPRSEWSLPGGLAPPFTAPAHAACAGVPGPRTAQPGE